VIGGENLNKRDDMDDVDLHEDNIKVLLKEIEWENVDRIYPVLDRDK
jgi:hypothetical protein